MAYKTLGMAVSSEANLDPLEEQQGSQQLSLLSSPSLWIFDSIQENKTKQLHLPVSHGKETEMQGSFKTLNIL